MTKMSDPNTNEKNIIQAEFISIKTTELTNKFHQSNEKAAANYLNKQIVNSFIQPIGEK